MKSFQHSIEIDAPVDTAWRLLSDVARWPDWLPTVTRVTPMGPDVVEPGARFVLHQPRLPRATWSVTEVSPPRSFVWESHSPGSRTRAAHQLTARGPGTCTLELRFAFSGWLGTPIGFLLAGLTRSYLAQECAALKAAAEESIVP